MMRTRDWYWPITPQQQFPQATEQASKMEEEEARTVYADPDEFAQEMVKMINEKEFSDIRFIVGEERTTIYAHKSILATRCEVFRAMFADTSVADGSPLVLSDMKPIIFMAVLEYVYTNCCSLSTQSVIEVLHSSIEYGLDGLRKICVRFMMDTIAVETVCDFLQAALTFDQLTLRDECMAFIEKNTHSVFESKGFSEVSADTLSYLLQSDRLNMEEEDILDKVKEWANISSVVNGCSLAEAAEKVIVRVRFPLLSTEVLTRVDDENKVKHFIPETIIASAWKFHALQKPLPGDPQTTPRIGTTPKPTLKCLGLETQL